VSVSQNSAGTDELLLRDLADVFSAAGSAGTGVSVGLLGQLGGAAQPPAHCLRTCLSGDPAALAERGCAFLRAAARNETDPAHARGGTCDRGYRTGAQTLMIGGRPATIVTLAGAPDTAGHEGSLPVPPGSLPLDVAGPLAPALLGQLDATARLVQRVGQLVEENSGFANEVLQNYEQLNLIFELTQQIAHVTDARVIEKLLLQRIGRLLQSHTLLLVTDRDECRVYDPAGRAAGSAPALALALPSGVRAAVEHVRRTRQVRVAVADGRQIIAGPLMRLDSQVDVVVAERASGAFSSGDMLLVESMLSFGGQIISNTELHERLRRMSLEVTRAMVAAIDKKDHYTSGHSERGGFLTRITAQALGISPAEQQTMEWAGLLHDIGKIGIPEEILCKPGKLTPEEFEVVKRHPTMGYEILKPIASFEVVLDGVLYHHEYPDGSGYPRGLRGDEIPLVARIIHVVDTFDALTSTRAYRNAFSIEKALEIIRSERGVRIDPRSAEAFFAAFEAYRREEPEDFVVCFGAREVAHGAR
jgi:HD-GYP domain-containing protein (c-di-GMP phosphodiesterase class II)